MGLADFPGELWTLQPCRKRGNRDIRIYCAQGVACRVITSYSIHYTKLYEISLPNTHLAVPAYYVVAPAECSSNLSRFDGVRFGYRAADPRDLKDLYERSRGEGFGPEVKRRILIGTYALSSGYYDVYYLKAQQVRRLIREDFMRAFEAVV